MTPFDSEVQAASIFVDLNLQRGFTVLITGKEAPPSRRVFLLLGGELYCPKYLKKKKGCEMIFNLKDQSSQQRPFFKHLPAPDVKFRKG